MKVVICYGLQTWRILALCSLLCKMLFLGDWNLLEFLSYSKVKEATTYYFKLSISKQDFDYQVPHFFLGFILEPEGQLNAVENSGKFCKGPFTLEHKIA